MNLNYTIPVVYGNLDGVRFQADPNTRSDPDEETTLFSLKAVSWDNLMAEATILPELKHITRRIIEINLGYLPSETVMLPFEPYLRVLIQRYFDGQLTEEDFLNQEEEHIRLIRNADMRHNTCLTYDEAIYQNYHETFAPYGYAVRERLSRFLGYEPELRHSLIAEMWFRDILADQTYRLPDDITEDDIRAMTLVKYREVLLAQGKDAADRSPMFGAP